MTYRGRVKDGVVVLDDPTIPAEGTLVEVSVVDDAQPPTWGEVLKDVIGKAEGLPEDMAENHDHYIHGTPRK